MNDARRGSGRALAGGAALLAVLALTGCDLGVTNPGAIEDDALNNPDALQPLVVGMAADLSQVLDDIGYFGGILGRDIWHSGAFEEEIFMQEGNAEPRHVNDLWADMHRARWVAEQGILRMEEILGGDLESEPLATEAHIWAGYSNRVLGENVCQAVIDGGPAEPHTVHFERAETYFDRAIQLAQAQGEEELLERAYAGRAQVRLAQGEYDAAAQDAARVSDDFSFLALFSTNSGREENWLTNQSHIRRYFTVYGTWAAETDDPRVPWEDEGVLGVDGTSPFYRQDKYTELGSDMELAAVDEMLLIRAEAALRGGDVDGAVALINDVRAAAGVDPVSADTAEEAMALLRQERNIVLWMEGRHLFDLRRFDDAFLSGRDECIPPSENEVQTNPNL